MTSEEKREPLKGGEGDEFKELATQARDLLRSMQQVEDELRERLERVRGGAIQ